MAEQPDSSVVLLVSKRGFDERDRSRAAYLPFGEIAAYTVTHPNVHVDINDSAVTGIGLRHESTVTISQPGVKPPRYFGEGNLYENPKMELLKDNVSNLQNIKIVHGALVGTSEKSIQLNNRGTGGVGYTVVAKPSDKPNASFIEETPAFRLSDLLLKNEKVGLLKLDIEGAELSLLEHDIEALKSIDVVFAELHDRIAPGCVKKFIEFSEDRILINDKGEKFLSVRR